MEKKDIKDILENLPAGNYSEEHGRIAKLWLFQLNNKNRATPSEYELDNSKAEVWHRLEGRLASRSRRVKLWPRIVSVAAAIALMVLGVYFFYYNSASQNKDTQLVANDVDPGKMGATLTLANGKKIRLTDANSGKLADEAGVAITKSEDGQIIYEIKDNLDDSDKINTLTTANGETYRLHLPDGSTVWLNAASSLTYSANLVQNGKRKVKLIGEGYFEVAKDKAHPFIVSTNNQEVEVLGTHFNINSYPDEPSIITTLLEGRVMVSTGDIKQMLKPGEKAINNGNAIKVGQADIDNITDWKDGGFDLGHQNFKAVMRKIARWYNVEVVYDASVPDDLESGGWISRDEKLSAVLKAISSTGLARFKMEGRKIYVSK